MEANFVFSRESDVSAKSEEDEQIEIEREYPRDNHDEIRREMSF